MELFLSAIAVFFCAAAVCAAAKKSGHFIGLAGVELGCALGLASVVSIGLGSSAAVIRREWTVPGSSLYLSIDALALLFLAVLFVITGLTAVYAYAYLKHDAAKRRLGFHWSSLNIFIASMAVAIAARNVILFLIAWELMTISSFFLVAHENSDFHVRRASFVYLVATNIGTAFLLLAFFAMGKGQSVLDYENLRVTGTAANIAFICALAGFGLKSGIVPLHTWLPQAHPAAPSHISALMSGVMIKMGIYGLLRTLEILGPGPAWWGVVLICLGSISGILGVLFALGQHDLKRLLAYHSVENIGIIVLGLGIAVLAQSLGHPVIAALGYAGALLHVVNHAVFKGLLFLGAGVVAQTTGTRELDALGGLSKKMPLTALCFLTGSVAISGLPPLNGFVSEFLIYTAGFQGIVAWKSTASSYLLLCGALLIVSLALIGGLALACFAKAFGVVFLGEPRSPHVKHASEPGAAMAVPMIILSAICFVIGLCSAYVIEFLGAPVSAVSGIEPAAISQALRGAAVSISMASSLCALFLLLCAALALFRKALLRRRTVRTAVTWDCGYLRPASSMQYTASSFAQPIVDFFAFVLFPSKRPVDLKGLFPGSVKFRSHVPDVFADRLYHPVAAAIQKTVARLRERQPTSVHFFAGYIIGALILLVIWNYLQGIHS